MILIKRYFKWLEDDYKRKSHKGLNGLSPHDVLMSQISKLNLVTDINRINEHFLLRITRKIQPDATTQIQNILYELIQDLVVKELKYGMSQNG